ncbi:hypothetical protein GCM10022199_18330 [Marihabitans asiaticum]|uniref:Preprotein translocase subunit YajC n=2 Tax=Marihabitans asiaticum TaxID=415218 RepID=A0A560W6P5_9MICO|nr:preprotein translocase subunit YajC [Marihabitans asiaticum]
MNEGSLGSLLILLLPLLLIIFMIVSGRRRQRVMEEFNASLAVGEEVVTTSGIYGRLVELSESTAELEIAPRTVITVDRRAIGMRAPGTAEESAPEATE